MERLDSYGQTLPLLFLGADRFKTRVGGVVSVLVKLVLILYASQKIVQLVGRTDPVIINTRAHLTLNDTQGVNLGENGFDLMAIVFRLDPAAGNPEPIDIPASIGHIRMVHGGVDEEYNLFGREVPKISCKHAFGAKLNDTKWVLFSGAKYPKCFDMSHRDATIGGGEMGEAGFKSISYQFMKCGEKDKFMDKILNKNKTEKCQSNQSIKKWLSDKYINIHLKQNWVDYGDYETPIKIGFHSIVLEALNKQSSIKMSLVQVDVELEDSIFNSFIPFLKKTENFVISDSLTDSTSANDVFQIDIMMKNDKKIFKRKVYSFLDMMADIGGLYDALFLITGFLINSYNAKMFELELVKSLFKFQKTPIKFSAKIKKVQKQDLIEITENIAKQKVI